MILCFSSRFMFLNANKFLEKDLEIVADAANEGFIVFSLGSAIPVSSMPPDLIELFVKVFAKFPSQKVFWKWEKTRAPPKKISRNVKIVEWLPQQDLLGTLDYYLFSTYLISSV